MALFYRVTADQQQSAIALEETLAGTHPTAAWLIGGAPSLAELPCAAIARTPIARIALNLAGTRLVRPTIWTSYDPSVRFHRSIYLDAGVQKFVHRRRALDLIPETTSKVCEAPSLYVFDRQSGRGYADWLSPGVSALADWRDSFLQSIELAYRLGLRTLYLAGCDLHVRPSAELIEHAALHGVTYHRHELLVDFHRRCRAAGLNPADRSRFPAPVVYHFDETKSLAALEHTDQHYFRATQILRLARRWMSLAGLTLVSVTPDSRLNDYFAYRPADEVVAELLRAVSDPQVEPTRGLYSQSVPRFPAELGPMRDIAPPVRPFSGGPTASTSRPQPTASPTCSEHAPAPTRPLARQARQPVLTLGAAAAAVTPNEVG